MKPATDSALRTLRFATVLAFLHLIAASTLADIQLLSVPSSPAVSSASAGGDSYMPVISSDGRFVLFASTANNLTPDSSNIISLSPTALKMNVYCRDRSNGITTLVSVNLSGTGANDDCIPIALSTNGQFALFESSASDLIAGDTNGGTDVFVRDIETGNTILVSVGTNGFSGNNASADSTMAPDGRFVAFASRASDLVTGDTNRMQDIFVRDLQTSNTTFVSAGAFSALWAYEGGSVVPSKPLSSSDLPEITPDGRYVAFRSTATNLVPGVTTIDEVYVRDLVAESTFVISTNARPYFPGALPNSLFSFNHVISADGQFVAFETCRLFAPASGSVFRKNVQNDEIVRVATNALYASGNFGEIQTLDMSADGRYIAFIGKPDTALSASTSCVYVWDAQSATTRIISTNLDGSVSTNSACSLPIFDPTGEFISFLSTATNLTTNLVTSEFHLYVHELASGVTKLVDVTTNGTGSKGTLWSAQSLSPDGRFVAFDSDSPNLVANDGNQCSDVFLRDLLTGTTELISVHDSAFPSQTTGLTDNSARLSLSADGRYAAFASSAIGLVGNSTNRRHGVFVRDLLNGVNFLASKDTNGIVNGNGASVEPAISGNGKYVAFTSFANNLAPLDGNQTSDVFVCDLNTGAISLLSTNRFNNRAGNGASRLPSVSSDGRFVLFYSLANFADFQGSPFATDNLYLRDQLLKTNYTLTRGGVVSASMTPDGRYIAFVGSLSGSPGSTLYIWDSLSATRVYTNTTSFLGSVSISPSGRLFACSQLGILKVWDWVANTNKTVNPYLLSSLRPGLKFSTNDRFLVYATWYAIGVVTDTNSLDDVFLYDLLTATNIAVSRSTNLISTANGASYAPDISGDGRFIVYSSSASDLVAGDGNRAKDVFLYDRQTGTTTHLSASAYGARPANRASTVPVFSGDGQTLMFQSFASDLVENDFNQGVDAFFLRLASTNPVFTGQIVYAPGAGQPPTLTWIAPPGKSYRVEFKDALTDPAWQPLTGNVSIVGDIGHATDLTPNPNHRFYRIVAY